MQESYDYSSGLETTESPDLDRMLYARHAEVTNADDLMWQRGTPIPALFNNFYKFVQNPSTVSVETFKRMIDTDDTIGSGIDFLITCLAARLGKYQHESDEITEFVNKALAKIDGGFVNCLKEMMGACWAGFSVQEKVWANDDSGFIVKKLVSLPPGTVLFETERTGELTRDGILQYQRNYNPANLAFGTNFLFGFLGGSNTSGMAFRPDPYAKFGDLPFPMRTANVWNYLSIRIPRVKCLHYAFNASGKLGNPYGRSLLRRVYKWYVMKDAFLQMLSIALDRKGTPLTLVYADPNVTLADPDKANIAGSGARGQTKVGIRADQAAQKAFKNIHNDTTIILPGKKGQVYETDFVPQASNANDFIEATRMCDRGIMRGILVPSLIFGNGDGSGSFALGQEHAKTFDKILDGINAGVEDVLIDQLVKELICYNFPKSAWEKDGFGGFNKRELSIDEVEKESSVIETAVNTGAIDMNDLTDLNQVRDKLRFEPRDKPIIKQTLPPEYDFGDNGEGEGEGEEGADDRAEPRGEDKDIGKGRPQVPPGNPQRKPNPLK